MKIDNWSKLEIFNKNWILVDYLAKKILKFKCNKLVFVNHKLNNFFLIIIRANKYSPLDNNSGLFASNYNLI